tara:strand:- start:493 stop:834 length:342 start_codon:yes stop_codon:yes gene_type:complete
MAFSKESRRNKIRRRVRATVSGTSEMPRLAVFRSNKEIYAQLINDIDGKTIAAASSMDVKGTKIEQAGAVGKAIAEKSIAIGVSKVVFDRGGYLYHGRVKALADGARESGLKF